MNLSATCTPASNGHFLSHAVFIAVIYVLCLYILVPPSIRALPRHYPIQIKARLQAISFTVTLLVALYFPLTFCSSFTLSYLPTLSLPLPSDLLGLISPFLLLPTPLLHIITLFLGPIVTILATAHTLQASALRGHSFPTYTTALYHALIVEKSAPPTLNITVWPLEKIRDLLLGPLTEELTYRSLLVPYLLAAGLTPTTTVFIAPTFFGFAHFHHAINSLRAGESLSRTALITAFQFMYTYLFGLYCTYALLVTGSVMGPVLCHCFCNFMGLPDLEFNGRGSRLFEWRRVIWGSYGVGIAGFVAGFFVMGHVDGSGLVALTTVA